MNADVSLNGPESANILIVDDEEAIRDILSKSVTSVGMNCFKAKDSDEALNLLKSKNFEIVVSDISMPGLNGIQLCQTIKSEYDADVILMTGNFENFSYADAITEGAEDFILKPFSVKELCIRIQKLLTSRKTTRELKRLHKAQQETLVNLKTALSNLNESVNGVTRLLSSVAEIRDPYTAGHQLRVAEIAGAIANGLEMQPPQIEGLMMAGNIHDIGKIAVPAEILTKTTRLSENEFGLIKTHPKVGYDLLKKIDFPWPIAEMVLQHHWRINGSGYPEPIINNNFLMESKIIGVADVVEAIISHRPYRPALGPDKALEEITQNKGILYDSDVVESCTHLFSEKTSIIYNSIMNN